MLNKFGVHIKVKDFEKSYNFYKSFGLKPAFTYGRPEWLEKVSKDFPELAHANEKYDGITFELGSSLLEIANGHIAVKPEAFKEDISSPKISAMIDVDSISEIVDICNKNNYKISVEPKDYYWGTREVVVKDPDGFVIVFRELLRK
jgi:catechol 2,3-dioxygenase-like lactoylglutathione lyase family enzyme